MSHNYTSLMNNMQYKIVNMHFYMNIHVFYAQIHACILYGYDVSYKKIVTIRSMSGLFLIIFTYGGIL